MYTASPALQEVLTLCVLTLCFLSFCLLSTSPSYYAGGTGTNPQDCGQITDIVDDLEATAHCGVWVMLEVFSAGLSKSPRIQL